MLAVLCDRIEPGTEVVAVEEPFSVPLIDQETGDVLDRDLVGTLDLLERDPEGRLAVVDLKTCPPTLRGGFRAPPLRPPDAVAWLAGCALPSGHGRRWASGGGEGAEKRG